MPLVEREREMTCPRFQSVCPNLKVALRTCLRLLHFFANITNITAYYSLNNNNICSSCLFVCYPLHSHRQIPRFSEAEDLALLRLEFRLCQNALVPKLSKLLQVVQRAIPASRGAGFDFDHLVGDAVLVFYGQTACILL